MDIRQINHNLGNEPFKLITMECGTIFMIIFGVIAFGLMIYFIDKAIPYKKSNKEKDRISELERRICYLEDPSKFKKGDKVAIHEYDCETGDLGKIKNKGIIAEVNSDYNDRFNYLDYKYTIICGNDLINCIEYELKKC